jgi:MFS family permease
MGRIRRYGRETFASLKIRNYRLYFIGQAISLCGTWMQTVAQGWLVLELTGSGTELGGVLAVQYLPILLLGPWGGVITDRFDKRVLLYWTQSIAGLLALTLGVLVLLHMAALWMVYVLSFLLGLIKVVDNPARQTFVSEMVGPAHVRNAVTLSSTAANLARVVGPAIGGVLIVLFGIGWSFIFNAVSFIAVLVMLAAMRQSELSRQVQRPKERGQIKAGLAYVRDTPVVRDTLLLMVIIGTLSYEFQVSLPLLAKITFMGDAASYAVLLAAMGAGSVLGGLYAASRKAVTMQQLVFFTVLFGASMLAVGLMPTFPLAALGMVVVGFFSINVTSLGNTLVQLESVPHMRGRVMALWSMAIVGSTPIGGPIIGWVGEHWGPRFTMYIGGVAALLAALYILRLLRAYAAELELTESVEQLFP